MTKAPGSGSGPSPVSAAGWVRPATGLLVAVVTYLVTLGLLFAWNGVRSAPAWLGAALDLVVLLGPLLVGALIAARLGGPRLTAALGVRLRAIDLLLGFLVALIARAIVEVITPTAGSLVSPFAEGSADQATATVVTVIGLILLAPIVEEVFFRGALQRALAAWLDRPAGPRVAAIVAVAVTTVLFTLMHALPYGAAVPVGVVVPPLLVGVGAGVLVAVTGRLGGALVTHVLFNAAGVALLLV